MGKSIKLRSIMAIGIMGLVSLISDASFIKQKNSISCNYKDQSYINIMSNSDNILETSIEESKTNLDRKKVNYTWYPESKVLEVSDFPALNWDFIVEEDKYDSSKKLWTIRYPDSSIDFLKNAYKKISKSNVRNVLFLNGYFVEKNQETFTIFDYPAKNWKTRIFDNDNDEKLDDYSFNFKQGVLDFLFSLYDEVSNK